MVEFPQNPTTGQQWVAENTVTYTWLGDRWSSAIAVSNGTAVHYKEGGRASTTTFSDEYNGGTA
jgi:hypothetical protein